MKPTTQYRRRHDVEAPAVDASAFRQGWRVRTRLEQLRHDGLLSIGELQAGLAYRDAWEAVLASYRTPALLPGTGGSADAHARMWANLADITQIRRAELLIGPEAARLCFTVAVEDRSWPEVGRMLGRDRQTARRRAVDAFRCLAAAWSYTPRSGLQAPGNVYPATTQRLKTLSERKGRKNIVQNRS